MWMSQGFLGCNMYSEEEGEACFESLARRSFFQNFEKGEFDGSIESCKMHDIVCDFVKFLTKDEYLFVEVFDGVGVDKKQIALTRRTRHLTIDERANKEIVGALKYDEKCKTKLRTMFFLSRFSSIDQVSLFLHQTHIRTLIFSARSVMLKDIGKLIHLRYLQIYSKDICEEVLNMICDLYNLQTLDLSCSYFENIPENISKLVNLRYLDLTCCGVRTLPDSICNLPKLQTLNLESCYRLERLPKGLGKLVDLRHLILSSCGSVNGYLPKGITSLTGLETLNMDLRITKDRESYLHAGDMKALRHVLKIQRYFSLHGCTNIRNASEAHEIGVTNMELLPHLTLGFSDDEQSEEKNGIEDHEREILEALQPSPSLKSLEIWDYMGTTVSPKWMMSLINLTSLELNGCTRCSILPTLGKLPSLESLHIIGFETLKEVGPEFLGLENVGGDIIGKKSSFIPFPKLKYLRFGGLDRWESWVGSRSATKDTSTVIMPSLIMLELYHCESLKSLPDFLPLATMKCFKIAHCKILEAQYQESSSTKRDQISHIPVCVC